MKFIRISVMLFAALLSLVTRSASADTILRVDPVNGLTILGGATGADWTHAYLYLQDALAAVTSGNYEIWVADGVNLPDHDSSTHPDGSEDRDATFNLKNHVNIMGGFHGNINGANGETLKSQRDPYTNITILSGDLLQNDVSNPEDPEELEEDAYHVVTGIHVDETCILDGFTIRRGNAAGSPDPYTDVPGGRGGGMVLVGGEGFGNACIPNILRCRFEVNIAEYGGGLFTALGQGNAPLFFNCIFFANRASYDGGAVHNYGPGDPCDDDELLPTGAPFFINCLAFLNHADGGQGGAMYSDPLGGLRLHNCTIADNDAYGITGGIFHANPCPGQGQGGSTILYASILWGNGGSSDDAQIDGPYSKTNCDIQGIVEGGGNISQNPQFVTNTYRLSCGSPCIDHGLDIVYDGGDAFDLNQEGNYGEQPPDLDLHDRFIAEHPDMGAYEKQPEGRCLGDIVPLPCGNGIVNVSDLLAVINTWGACPVQPHACPADIANNGHLVNTSDLLAVINNWGPCPNFTGGDEGYPQSVQDCMDDCSELYEAFTAEWYECVNGCVDGLCKAHIIDCD